MRVIFLFFAISLAICCPQVSIAADVVSCKDNGCKICDKVLLRGSESDCLLSRDAVVVPANTACPAGGFVEIPSCAKPSGSNHKEEGGLGAGYWTCK